MAACTIQLTLALTSNAGARLLFAPDGHEARLYNTSSRLYQFRKAGRWCGVFEFRRRCACSTCVSDRGFVPGDKITW